MFNARSRDHFQWKVYVCTFQATVFKTLVFIRHYASFYDRFSGSKQKNIKTRQNFDQSGIWIWQWQIDVVLIYSSESENHELIMEEKWTIVICELHDTKSVI